MVLSLFWTVYIKKPTGKEGVPMLTSTIDSIPVGNWVADAQ